MTHDEILKLVAYGKFSPEVATWFIAYGTGAAEEREECAKIAWERFGTAGREIAGAIRARGQK